eukprot:4419927-Pyramimonas_sp.AAC.1
MPSEYAAGHALIVPTGAQHGLPKTDRRDVIIKPSTCHSRVRLSHHRFFTEAVTCPRRALLFPVYSY